MHYQGSTAWGEVAAAPVVEQLGEKARSSSLLASLRAQGRSACADGAAALESGIRVRGDRTRAADRCLPRRRCCH